MSSFKMKNNFLKSKYTIAILAITLVLLISYSYYSERKFAFAPTPPGGQIGNINGIFVHEKELELLGQCSYEYDVIQLFDDGTVIKVPLCSDENIIEGWSDVKKWFNRDTEIRMSRGKYYVLGNQIWFRTEVFYNFSYIEHVVVDYMGVLVGNKLVLDSFSHKSNHEEKGSEYLKLDVEK